MYIIPTILYIFKKLRCDIYKSFFFEDHVSNTNHSVGSGDGVEEYGGNNLRKRTRQTSSNIGKFNT